ncbi:MAG: hypothetical protein ACRD19_05475 [Terriglobia bacterium]
MSDEKENIVDRMFKKIGKSAEEAERQMKKEADGLSHKAASIVSEAAQQAGKKVVEAGDAIKKGATGAGHEIKNAAEATGHEIEKESRS